MTTTSDSSDVTVGVDDEDMAQQQVIQAVVFGKSIRSHYAIFHVAAKKNQDTLAHVVVRFEFVDNHSVSATQMRSWSRRSCKLGDLVIFQGQWVDAESNSVDKMMFLVKVATLEHALQVLTVAKIRHWSMPQCQEWQQRYRPKNVCNGSNEERTKKRVKIDKNACNTDDDLRHHGGDKREQGECVANFVIRVMLHSLERKESDYEGGVNVNVIDWVSASDASESSELRDKAIEALNKGSGVIDAAGGSGYVSMALGLKGIKSTVVDPREAVGKLPKRDRKVWNRLLRGVPLKNGGASSGSGVVCQQIVPYDSVRAWFARTPPQDVDTSFRHGDVESIPVCGEEHDLLANCCAIVALHPDEATDAIVDMAVKRRLPFVVVPCCVFSRLFSNRRQPGSNLPVSTYDDLLNYLASKHQSIQRTTLPFEGANVALWSVF